MKHISYLVIVILASALAGCNLAASPATSTTNPTSAPTLGFAQPSPNQPQSPEVSPTTVTILPTPLTAQQAVFDRAAQVVVALKDKDMTSLAHIVSPTRGLRFSPYAAVKDTDQVFTADKLAGLFSDNTAYTWGAYAGSGESMSLTFTGYYAQFIYDEDFANAPHASINYRLGVGTTLDNAADYYPGAMIVEFYFPGFDLTLEGLDWRSLRLVFEQEGSTWYLVGIIHDQWTT